MKYFTAILAAAGLALGAYASQPTLPDPVNVFGVGATNNGSTTAWAIISPRSANGGTPVITAIDAACDTPNTASVHLYQCTEFTQCTFTNTTVSIPVTTTNTGTKWDTGFVVVWHKLYDTCERRILATSGGATNLEVTVATITAVTPGDIIYKVVDNNVLGNLNMVTNTIAANRMYIQRANSTPLAVGQKGKPLLVEVTATNSSAAFVNNVSGYYAP